MCVNNYALSLSRSIDQERERETEREIIFQAHVFDFKRFIWSIYLLMTSTYISIELHHWAPLSIDTSLTVNLKLCWGLYFAFFLSLWSITERMWGGGWWADGVRAIQSHLNIIAKTTSYRTDPLSKISLDPSPFRTKFQNPRVSHSFWINYAWSYVWLYKNKIILD